MSFAGFKIAGHPGQTPCNQIPARFLSSALNYPGAQEIAFRICGDKSTGRLLGAQLIGHWKSEIAKRADIFATALFHNMTLRA